MDVQDLRAAVEAQAQARIDGDLATFASYMTPHALLRMHRSGAGPRSKPGRDFDVIDVQANRDVGYSDVRYTGSGSYVLRTRWERRNGAWKAVIVEVPRDLVRVAGWKRIVRFVAGRDDQPFVERRDIS